MTTNHIMKVSANGQVSIPAAVRARWGSERVVVVDLGDRLVVRPLPADAVGSLVGKYRGRGPSTESARRATRLAEAAADRRKRG